MPKRGKRKPGDGREEYEGRPADLTLGLFFQTSSVSPSQTDSVSVGAPSKDEQTSSAEKPTENQDFFVTRTKKGKLPITYENRSKGKKVTVISNVSGNADALLTELRRRLGVGGVSRGTFVEIQGDQQKFVEQFLTNHPCTK